jgi:NADH-quinone oxidoreductase subunit M
MEDAGAMMLALSNLTLAAQDSPSWLVPAMVIVPLLAAFAALATPATNPQPARVLALVSSILTFLLNLAAMFSFDWKEMTGMMQLAGSLGSWIAPLGVDLSYGVDAVSFWLVLLTTFLMPVIFLGTWDDVTHRAREFYFWLLLLQAALVGVFVTTNLIVFYIFFELTLVPLFFLIGIFGSTNRRYAALKFFVFTLAGSVFTFAGVLYIASRAPEWTFDIAELRVVAAGLTATEQAWLLAAFMAGFAVKVPLFPVHTWLPLAHTEAPTAGSAVLAGVLLKLGTYGLLRFALPFVPVAAVRYAPAVAVLCIIGILYAALICWVQTDVKRLVAYSSVSHMGFCVLGLFAFNPEGVGGSVMYMINHGLSTGALFLCVGMVYRRLHTRDMNELAGLGRRLPIWGTFMMIFVFSSVGLPGLNGFVGEFLTTFGAYKADKVLGIPYAAAAALGVIFGAIYILYMAGKVVLGPSAASAGHAHGGHAHGHDDVPDLNGKEIASLLPLAIVCLVLGLFPTPILRSLEPAIKDLTSGAVKQIASTPGPAVVEAPLAAGEAGR